LGHNAPCFIVAVMTARLVIVLLLFLSPAVLLGGDKNEKCPLMTSEDVDSEQTVEYEGVKVLFCCQNCRKVFNANPKYVIKASLDLLPQFAALKAKLQLDKVELLPQRYCPVEKKYLVTPESPTVDYKGAKVYLWDKDAVEEWKKDPDGCAKRAIEAGLLPQLGEKKGK
jgi:YHS domain-containing protein